MPAENLVGELNAGWSVLQTALAYERRFMGDLARTAKDDKRPRRRKGAICSLELARDAGRLGDPYIRQQIARVGRTGRGQPVEHPTLEGREPIAARRPH